MNANIVNLREIVRRAIAPTISIHRKPEKTLAKYKEQVVTEEEIDEFLFSIPYLDRALCYYLLGNGIISNNETSLWVTDNWIQEFERRIQYWAESSEWLKGNLILIHYPGFMGRAMIDDDTLRLPRLIFEIKA